ncbi:hypothetical protein THAOC_20771, partial [Thalassiosira oceanica]
MVKQRKESEWTEAAASSATTKKARCCKVGEAVATSTADELELGDTPCYSQKSRQNNDIGVGQHWPKIAAKVGGGGSDSGNLDILSILDIECALPTLAASMAARDSRQVGRAGSASSPPAAGARNRSAGATTRLRTLNSARIAGISFVAAVSSAMRETSRGSAILEGARYPGALTADGA